MHINHSAHTVPCTEDGRLGVRMQTLEYADKSGRLTWETLTGEVYSLWVAPAARRRGLATGLWTAALALHPVQHSQWRTEEGDAFARSVGGVLPVLLHA